MPPADSIPYQPPAGFAQVESKVPGITVYAPRPPDETGPEARTFTCPQCGASTAYEPAAAGVACAHCGFQQPVRAEVVGQAAPEAEFTVEAYERELRGWGGERRELHCESCGADLSLTPQDLSATCAFCASNRVVARLSAPDTLRPRFLIPFNFDAAACARPVRQWLGQGWMHPEGLTRAASTARFTGLYLPFWTFDARVDGSWQAEVGYERSESYYDGQADEWRTRTVVDWRWERGQVTVPVDDQLEAGTTKVSPGLLRQLYPFDLSALAAYDPGFLAGWQALAGDVPLRDAWDAARVDMRDAARRACRDQIASPHVRNFSITADFADESWRYILLPVFIAAYRFGGKAYQVFVNGQTGAVAGHKPVAWWKVWLAIAGLLTPGACLGLVGLPLLAAGGIGLVPLAIGAVLFIAGLIAAGILLRQAMTSIPSDA